MNSFNIKNLIRSQLPSFVLDYHPIFLDFMVAYYEWLADEENEEFPKSSMSDYLLKSKDVDRTIDMFFDGFRKTYLENFPLNLAFNQSTGERLNARTLLKNIKRFYSAKGSEKSYKFLFRILYNSDVSFYYPKKDILRLSDGKWSSNTYIRISAQGKKNPFRLIGKELFQRFDPYDDTSSYYARARVVDVVKKYQENHSIVELRIENLVGSFLDSLEVYCDAGSGVESFGKPSKILQKITILNRGKNYNIGDKINFLETSSNEMGLLPDAFVSKTSSVGNILGQVQEITINNPGFMVGGVVVGEPSINSQTPYFLQGGISGGATGFQCSLTKGVVFEERGEYIGNDGKLSSNKVIQDNVYYQDYSYVLRTDKTIQEVKSLVKELIHPSGYELFIQIFMTLCSRGSISGFLQIRKKSEKRIGNYLPYTFRTFDDLSTWFDTNCYSTGTHDSLIINASNSGNPLSSNVSFVVGATCVSAGVSGDFSPSTEYGYWLVYSHPNTYLNKSLYGNDGAGYNRGPALTRIHSDQLIDFYGRSVAGTGQSITGWQEWIYSNTNLGVTSEQVSFFNSMSGSEHQEALLVNLDDTEFRKINIGEFLNEVVFDYDCRYGSSTELFQDQTGLSGRYSTNYTNFSISIPPSVALD